jgi:hypothetical protein
MPRNEERMNNDNDTVRRLGGSPRWTVAAHNVETLLWRVEGCVRRVRRKRRTASVRIDSIAPMLPNGERAWPSQDEMVRAKTSLSERVAALAMGADVRTDFEWGVQSWVDGNMSFFCSIRFDSTGRNDVISEQAALSFAEGIAPFVSQEVERIERGMERREADSIMVANARKYVAAIVEEARTKGAERIDYEARIEALRRERDKAVLTEVDRLVATDELRSSLAEHRMEVDERALVAAYRLARDYVTTPEGTRALPLMVRSTEIPEAEILGACP